MMALVTCGLLMTAITVTANDFYVDVSWTGTASGTKNEPYTTIKATVDAANAAGEGPHNIYIAAGWYGDVANGGTVYLYARYSTGYWIRESDFMTMRPSAMAARCGQNVIDPGLA
jgi:hypothetical protein